MMKNAVIIMLMVGCMVLFALLDHTVKKLGELQDVNTSYAVKMEGLYQTATESVERLQLDSFIALQNSNRMQMNLDALKAHSSAMVDWGFKCLEYTGDQENYLERRMPNYPGLQPMLQVTNWAVNPRVYIYVR